jgi:pyruvate dehydrogenase E1 component alpha subunit
MATATAPDHASAAKTAKRPSDHLPDATLVGWLKDMLLIREFENRTAQAYQQAKIGGFCHLYTGQEALAVGTIAAVNHDDPIVTAYRDHGHALARGMSPEACMAEMFGKSTGCAKGKGGSMHMFDRPNWLFGGHGIVSAQNALGTGLAFAARYEWEVLGQSVEGGEATWSVTEPAPVEPGQVMFSGVLPRVLVLMTCPLICSTAVRMPKRVAVVEKGHVARQ